MVVKCLAQEHNTMFPARTRTWTIRSGVEHTNHEATAPPTNFILNFIELNEKEMVAILSFLGNDSLVVVCLPELFEHILTVSFSLVVLRLLVTRD